MGCNSSQTAPAWVLSMRCSPSGTDCSSVGPPWGHKLLQQTCSSEDIPRGHSFLWAHSSAPVRGLQVDICSAVDLHGLQRDNLPHHDLLHRLHGNFYSGALSPSPSLLTLVSAELFLSYILTPVSAIVYTAVFFSHLFKYVITEALPLLLISSALANSRPTLEAAGICFIRHSKSFLQKPQLYPALIPKSHHANPPLLLVFYCSSVREWVPLWAAVPSGVSLLWKEPSIATVHQECHVCSVGHA